MQIISAISCNVLNHVCMYALTSGVIYAWVTEEFGQELVTITLAITACLLTGLSSYGMIPLLQKFE